MKLVPLTGAKLSPQTKAKAIPTKQKLPSKGLSQNSADKKSNQPDSAISAQNNQMRSQNQVYSNGADQLASSYAASIGGGSAKPLANSYVTRFSQEQSQEEQKETSVQNTRNIPSEAPIVRLMDPHRVYSESLRDENRKTVL